MRQALWILRKDVRRLWPGLAVLWLLMAAAGFAAAEVPRNYWAGTTLFLWIPVEVVASFLVIVAVHEDSLIGDRQFSLTRPYSRKSLLLAKCLFVLLVVNLPSLVVQVATLLVSGLSPMHYFRQLVLLQVSGAASMLVIVTLAALTANLVQMVLVFVAALAALIAAAALVSRIGLHDMPRGAVAPIDDACQMAFGTVLFGVACWRQFTRRDRLWASGFCLCGMAVTFPVQHLLPWGVAFRLVAWQSPALDASAVRLAPGSATEPFPGPLFAADFKGIALPIQVTGIPDGMEVYSERIKIEVRAADGTTWNSGWDPKGEIRSPEFGYGLLPGKGPPYWLHAYVDRAFYQDHFADAVHVHATVAFTMLGRAHTTEVTHWNTPQPIASNGYCDFTPLSGLVNASCFAPFGRPALFTIRFQSPNEAFDSKSLAGQSQSPSSGEFGVWQTFEQMGVEAPRLPFKTYVETRQTVGHFLRELDVSGVHLKEAR
jgi:hypothetical protein